MRMFFCPPATVCAALIAALLPVCVLASTPANNPTPNQPDQPDQADQIDEQSQAELLSVLATDSDSRVNRSPAILGPATEQPTGDQARLYINQR
jgi:hypothetical protein